MSRADVGGDDARERLVVAGQALELEHLQNLIRSRDREAAAAAAATKRLLEEAGRQNGLLRERNSQLQEQVQLLAEKIRTATASRADPLGDDPSALAWRNVAQASGARDALLEEMRKEVAAGRQQIASLLEEREILLEKLVSERSRSALLSMQAAAADAAASWEATAPRREANDGQHTQPHAEKAVQTTDLGNLLPAAGYESGNNAGVDEQPLAVTTKELIDDLRQRIDLEQSLEQYFLDTANVHRANTAVLRDHLQRCLRRHMAILENERNESDRLMRQYSSAAPASSTTEPFENAAVVRTPVTAVASSRVHVVASPAQGQPSARHSAPSSAVTSPYYAQQESEMLHLRKRLLELQARHDATKSITSNGTSSARREEEGDGFFTPALAPTVSSSFAGSGSAAARSTLSAVAGRSDVLARMLSSASKGSTKWSENGTK